MIRKYFPLVLILLLCGCATTQKSSRAIKNNQQTTPPFSSPDTSPQLQNVAGETLEEYALKKGVVFAKTDFQGVLEATYVKLLIESADDQGQKFQLYIGDKNQQKAFAWDVQTVKPGYFFIELPYGAYKISSISIPVGSTLATEKLDVKFDVLPDAIAYMGTLRMVGTKEKIKLGGLPVIQPGFEFTTEIINDEAEGKTVFHQNYPNSTSPIVVRLMKINANKSMIFKKNN